MTATTTQKKDALNICCIGYNEQFLKEIGALLSACRFDCYQLTDPGDIFKEPRLASTDLILFQHHSNNSDCLNFFADIKKQQIKTPVVVISGNHSIEQAMGCIRAGARDYLFYPIHAEELEETIRRIVEAPPTTANSASLASQLENLEQHLQERSEHLAYANRQLTALTQIAAQFARVKSEQELIRNAPRMLTGCLDFDRASLILVDEEGRFHLSSFWFEKDAPETIQAFREQIEAARIEPPPAVLECYRENKTIYIPDARNDPRWAKISEALPLTTAVVVTPILIKGAPAGVLVGNMQYHQREMNSQDVTRLEMFARLVGLTLENLRAYRTLEGLVEERTASLRRINLELEQKARELERKTFSLGMANVEMLAAQEKLEQKNREMKELLRQLSQHKDQLQMILDSSPDAILMVDNRSRITAANQRIRDYFGVSVESVLGESFGKFEQRIRGCFENFSQYRRNSRRLKDILQTVSITHLELQRVYDLSVQINSPKVRVVLPLPKPVFSPEGKKLCQIWIFNDITPIKRANEMLHTIVEASPIPVVVSRLEDGRILYANRPVAKLLGVDVPELIGRHTPDFYANPEDRRSMIKKLRQKGVVENREVQIRRFDGETLWMIFSLTRTQVDGQDAVLGAMYDITQRRKMEEALRASEQQFRQLTENIHEAFWMYDLREEKTIYISPAFEDITGLKREELLEDFERLFEIIHPEDLPDVRTQMEAPLEAPVDSQYRIIRPDGEVRWILKRVFPIRNDRGEVYRICGVGEDITERKLAEEALQKTKDELELRVQERTRELAELNEVLSKSEVRNRALLNAIPDLMLRVHRNGVYLDFKAPRDSDLSLPPEAVIGKRVQDTLPPELARRILELVEKALETEEAQVIEYSLPHDSHVHHLEARIVRSGADEALAIVRDITERKQAEEALMKAHEQLGQRVMERTSELARANRELRETHSQLVQSEKMAALGMLVAGIAHEINTPVGAINSMHNTLVRALDKLKDILENEWPQSYRENRKLNATLKIMEDSIRVVASGSERVTNIVRRLRSFARLDEAELKEADIIEGIEDTLVLIHHEIKHHITLEKDFQPVPRIACYPGKLNQVFLNLLVNARQAIEGEGRIRISVRYKNGFVEVAISDNGKGIPEESLRKIFDPGFTTKGVGVGTGLGLSIVYQIIREDHHGDILVESKPGKGATFTVRIPDNLDQLVDHT